ncbi:hypothetical protein HAL07_02700 [Helicobacter ailurogastricus]|uniref:Uncharacterized protein n=1 Tax=Helicobacter ailurogastricus TaxID=1578720 RepID=A0A0K2Y2S7_9HELI|nr:hypothetical protein HAL07_02700 [Helicobacter ailurogastricus]
MLTALQESHAPLLQGTNTNTSQNTNPAQATQTIQSTQSSNALEVKPLWKCGVFVS